MSTVSVTNVKNASSSVNNAVTTSGGDLTNAAGVSFMGGSKNLLYNGAMQISQRNTSVTGITVADYYTADRFKFAKEINMGTWTNDIQNDAPTGSGFRKSYRLLVTTAQASPAASNYASIQQSLEGQDLQRIAKGTASAQQLTLSFWVKSNVTGTFIASLLDNANSRHVSASYTINASGTWERKTITFPADTTGAFANDNSNALTVSWFLGAGSNYTTGTLATTWASRVLANEAVGQTNLAAATNNYWQVTGVQLEVGPVATSFEFKSYQQELRECQRYYLRNSASSVYTALSGYGNAFNTTTARPHVSFPVSMRVAPTSVEYKNLAAYDGVNILAVSSASLSQPSSNGVNVDLSVTGATQYRAYSALSNNTTDSYLAFSAEL